VDQELQQLENIYNIITEFVVTYSFQILGALIVLIIGMFVANKISKGILELFKRKELDITLATFIANLIRIIIIVMVAIIALGKLGISMTPFIATVGAISLGAGLALQGLLSNYAAGMTIIVTRPFVVGNTIKINGINGVVEEIKLAATLLTNEDGELITVPNRHIVGEVLHNSNEYSLVEGIVGINYDNEPEKANQVIGDVLAKFDAISSETVPQIGIDNFGDSSINISYRYWIPTKEYFKLKYDINLAIFNALKQNDINIPYPQREVTLLNQDK